MGNTLCSETQQDTTTQLTLAKDTDGTLARSHGEVVDVLVTESPEAQETKLQEPALEPTAVPAAKEETKPEQKPESKAVPAAKEETKPEQKPESKPEKPTEEPTGAPKTAGPLQLDVKLTRAEGESLGLTVDCTSFANLVLVNVVKEGPSKGKLQVGDFITAIDGDTDIAGANFTAQIKKSQNPTLSVNRHTWDVPLQKTSGVKIGMAFTKFDGKNKYVCVSRVQEDGALAAFNAANPSYAVKVGDLLFGVNGSTAENLDGASMFDTVVTEATKDSGAVNLLALRRPA